MNARTEEGLVGKAVLVSLVLLALVAIAAFDAGSILLARYRVADLAERATYQARVVYDRTHGRRQACAAAEDLVEADDRRARIPDGGCVVDPTGREVRVTVRRTAGTLLVRRIPFLRPYGRAEATESLPLPS